MNESEKEVKFEGEEVVAADVEDPEEPAMNEEEEKFVADTSRNVSELTTEEPVKEDRPPFFSRERWRSMCVPTGLSKHLTPLILCLCALLLTMIGSWRCSYFKGAAISFTGNKYGLWSLEDNNGKCQLWDVLFFSYKLGGPLIAARVFSMTSMLVGLGLLATFAQASRYHVISWFLGFLIFILFIVSVSTTSIYNLWTIFFLFTYVVITLIVRALFIHPVHRKISRRGCKILAALCLVCAFSCLVTLVVLKSDFCTCKSIDADALSGRDPGDPCSGKCSLGAAGALMIVGSVFWLASSAAVIQFGIQPEFEVEEPSMFANYPRRSIATRIIATGSNMKGRVKKGSKEVHNRSKEVLNRGKEVVAMTSENTKPTEGVVDSQGNTTGTEAGESIEVGENKPSGEAENKYYNAGATEDASDEFEDEVRDTRTCCQKFCCDYRVKPRSRREKWRFWLFRIVLGLLVVVYLFIIVVKIGSRIENTNAAKAPDTSGYFITEVVCAYNPDDLSAPLQTFPTKAAATAAGYLVAHCGDCGYCSNLEDTKIYVDTRETIAKSSKKCGVKVVLGSYNDVVECLEGRIGFSRNCTKCWADNMINTARKCIFTCMTTMFTGFMTDNNVEGAGDRGWLNQCLFCDEKMSGPAFVTCSGVARRRLGIKSEIERNPAEQCNQTDVDWLEVDWETQFPGVGQ